MLSPDNQRGDWYLWVTNQSGHAAIVGVAAVSRSEEDAGTWSAVRAALGSA